MPDRKLENFMSSAFAVDFAVTNKSINNVPDNKLKRSGNLALITLPDTYLSKVMNVGILILF